MWSRKWKSLPYGLVRDKKFVIHDNPYIIQYIFIYIYTYTYRLQYDWHFISASLN